MPIGIVMPKSGISVETCVLTKWHKKAGDAVKKGDLLFSYETDKTSFDEEAPQDGILLSVFFNEGDDVPVMANVCALGSEGEEVSDFAPKSDKKDEGPSTDHQPVCGSGQDIPAPVQAASFLPQDASDRLRISPRARMAAAKGNIPYDGMEGTGPAGRIIERDIHRKAAQLPSIGQSVSVSPVSGSDAPSAADSAQAAYTDVKLSGIRKTIARNMVLSLSSMAQLTHTLSFDATEIMGLRAEIKKNGDDMNLSGITLNDMILYGVSRTLPEFPELNAHMLDGCIRLFHQVNLGMAVDTPRGLIVPAIFAADKMSLKQISERAKTLATLCQSGGIDPSLLHGGTFTVSNLGSFGIEHFTPIINPPQTGILGVGTIVQKVREVSGQLSLYPSIELSLTYDHRALDGAPASRFLKKLKENMEKFSFLLLE